MRSEQFEDVCEKLKLFNVQVMSMNHTMNSMGYKDGKLEVVAGEDMNLPKDILDLSTGLTQSVSVAPINILGNYAVAEHVSGPVEYNITFKYDRKFIYTLNHAYTNELYKRHNKEADEFIEKWLSE